MEGETAPTPKIQNVFEHTMSGFDLGESKDPKVELENTDSLAKVPEETDPQDRREEAQGLTAIINAREEEPGPDP